ncbi:pyridoxamine 5'-phosphate oxidase family protein [Chroococcidiopsis sp. FACHB-1243]|uniref:Npun_F5749 family FMN-dependent PPOX-type flavoprotein n=1 Tax=Chroococcidiopsis sp. [FACHB-1243] TaxID=2692781 RepID=UPI00177C2E93|nr:Npun_F5749 family FMN-dependent PPOX-type flavoprotein [Chroococcidiopsis sp. [FACHB-1243]]MBD2308182.1 pyridoxamine 5'-phosphate oxidase family protein [Chroococcidiopsis sp. [FACHB-1243]]
MKPRRIPNSLAPWRSPLARALHLNRSLPYARYLQLATVRINGRPANRTVVFRGFLENSDRLKFVSDTRSEKFAQIEAQPWAEACWYFPKTREQFRITGTLKAIASDCPDPELQQACIVSWQELSDSARLQFAWAHPELRAADDAFKPPAPSAEVPLPHFCLLLLEPVQVDRLELRGDPQNRTIYTWLEGDRAWSTQAVNP